MLNLEWLKEIEVIKHDFAYEIMAESTRESLALRHFSKTYVKTKQDYEPVFLCKIGKRFPL